MARTIYVVAMIAFATVAFGARATAESWYGREVINIVEVPSVPAVPQALGEKLTSLALNRDTNLPIRILDEVVEILYQGIDADAFSVAVAGGHLNQSPSLSSPSFGYAVLRKRVYIALAERAVELQREDAVAASRCARASMLLALFDFWSMPRQEWLQTFTSQPAINRMKFTELQLKQFQSIVELVQKSVSAAGDPGPFINAVGAAYVLEDGKMNEASLDNALNLALELWRQSSAYPNHRLRAARETWKLKCLARSINDNVAERAIVATGKRMLETARDPVSIQWANDVVSLDGPRPRGPGIVIIKPEHVRPGNPH